MTLVRACISILVNNKIHSEVSPVSISTGPRPHHVEVGEYVTLRAGVKLCVHQNVKHENE